MRPKEYDELVTLKSSSLNCFYWFGNSTTCPDKDYTATVVKQIVDQNFASTRSMTSEEIGAICSEVINEKRKKNGQSKFWNELTNNEVYHEEGEGEEYVAISRNEFLERVCKKTGKKLTLSAEERIQKYNKISSEKLIPGRVFDKKIPFCKILDFVTFVSGHKYELKELCSFITVKEIDTEILRYFFDNDTDANEEVKHALAMDLLYGSFSDTCALGGFATFYIDVDCLKNECNGCEFHTKKEKIYGGMTILEHIIARRKEDIVFTPFKNKLVELKIINP